MKSTGIRKTFLKIGLVFGLSVSGQSFAQTQIPDLSALFNGGQQQASPFSGGQASPWTNMMAPMGMMGGGMNPMAMMMNPENFLCLFWSNRTQVV